MKGARWGRLWEAANRQLTRDEELVFILALIVGSSLFFTFLANLSILRVIAQTTGPQQATLEEGLMEADGIVGAFLVAAFLIWPAVRRMWQDEEDARGRPKGPAPSADSDRDYQ